MWIIQKIFIIVNNNKLLNNLEFPSANDEACRILKPKHINLLKLLEVSHLNQSVVKNPNCSYCKTYVREFMRSILT